MTEFPGTAPIEDDTDEALAREEDQSWLRLDRRMLLVHPVDETIKFLPVLLVSFLVGSRSGNHVWGLAVVALSVVLGLVRWFTTTYRIGPVHVQLRRGIFQKRVLSIPRSRIRSVDVEARPLHRMLGLSVVRIGTGQRAAGKTDSNRFELNALSAELVPDLRETLLTHAVHPDPEPATETSDPLSSATEIGHWRPSWVRYAPFSITGIATIAALVGIVFQYGAASTIDTNRISDGVESLEHVGIALVILGGLVVLLAAASALACVRYLITFGAMTLTDDGRILHVSHGLISTRQTTLDRARLRGTTVKEPLLLRAAGGATLEAIMTGVSADKGESSLLLPQAPRGECERVMGTVIGDERQAAVPLDTHGPTALRRRFNRALALPILLAVVLLVLSSLGRTVDWTAWAATALLLVGAVALAWDRYRGLGHAVIPGWLVTRSGSLDRARHSLEADGIIGWTVHQTFFQRRSGVATVVAATPAGTGRYLVTDIPVEDAWALVEAVTPGGGDVWAHR
ncbi:PH domain-containing protein [Rhodococcus sp. NPDC058521]|uniref:PH domain-containing protein n=1 Tax=Rhodococcus sp. NPDC058521 TaxID=3346536 RepID=UPI0036551482